MSSPLVHGLRRGDSFAASVVGQIRSLVKDDKVDVASSIVTSLREDPDGEAVGRLASGVLSHLRGFDGLAWSEFKDVPTRLWAPFAPSEFVRTGLAQDPEETRTRLRELLAQPPENMGPLQWWEVLKPTFGANEALSREIFEIFEQSVRLEPDNWSKTADPGTWYGAEEALEWVRPWITADRSTTSSESVGAGVSFAVMDYRQPDRKGASRNIGDWVQTIASLGHLVRHQNVTFSGPAELVSVLEKLQSRVRPELVSKDTKATVDLVLANRDASNFDDLPTNTWMLAFGWFMHPIYGMRHDFPMHENILPIFVSFHCNKRAMLTPTAIDYLKKHGPVGCRDWTTVDLLLSLGVRAFFSGCLTTTVSTVFPGKPSAQSDAPTAFSDVPALKPHDAPMIRHSQRAIWRTPFHQNIEDALELLESLRRDFSSVLTSRLHCYLPTRSLGVPVDFQPKNRADVRFAGLIDITDEAFDDMRQGLLDQLEPVMTAILRGDRIEQVYEVWREVTAASVAAAQERRAARVSRDPMPPTLRQHLDAVRDNAVAKARTEPPESGDTADVVFRVADSAIDPVTVTMSSILEHTEHSVHAWLVGPTAVDDAEELAKAFPSVTFTGLVVDDRPSQGESLAHGLVLSLLPDLMRDVERVVLLPPGSLVVGNIGSLVEMDLGGNALAAANMAGRSATSGFGVLHGASLRGAHSDRAEEFRRQAYQRHTFDFDAFSMDVLVLDLSAMRQIELVRDAYDLRQEFDLSEREIFTFVFGPNRSVLPDRWAVAPTRTAVEAETELLYWPDSVKPSDRWNVPEKRRWVQQASRANAAKR